MNDSRVQVGLRKLPLHIQSSQNRLLIKGGKIVNDDRIFTADIYIEDGVIKQVGSQLTVPGGIKEIDASGKMIIPGGIDTNTHFQMPSMGTISSEDFYSGTKAALAGGTTTIIDLVHTPKNLSLIKTYEYYRELADSKVCCDFSLHMMVPQYNETVAQEMETLVKEKGVNSFEVFLSHPEDLSLEDDELFLVFRRCRELGALAIVHAENGKLIKALQDSVYDSGITGPEGHLYSHPEAGEVEATSRSITLADAAGCPLYAVRVMSAATARVICEARQRGVVVVGEVVAAAVGSDGSQYTHHCWRHAAGHVMSPPLRPGHNNSKELMNFLATGQLQCIGSDHCTFKADQKALGKDDFRKIPGGVNGVEDRLSIVWEKGVMTGILDPCQFVAVTSTNAAKIFNMYPRKGRIDVGSDADIVIWDSQKTRTISTSTHHQNVDFNIFEGMVCHGVPVTVLTGGRVVMEDGDLRVSQGAGRFVPNPSHSPHLYGRLNRLQQVRSVKPVKREPYLGPVTTEIVHSAKANGSEGSASTGLEGNSIRSRGPTRGGGRDMQESSFSLSGAQIDDTHHVHTSIRTKQPPGGVSTALW